MQTSTMIMDFFKHVLVVGGYLFLNGLILSIYIFFYFFYYLLSEKTVKKWLRFILLTILAIIPIIMTFAFFYYFGYFSIILPCIAVILILFGKIYSKIKKEN